MRTIPIAAALMLAAASASAANVTLRAAHTAAPNEPYQIGLQAFADALEKSPGGAGLKVEIFPNGQLGDEGSVLKSLQTGAIAIAVPANGPLADFVPELHIFDLPFLFRDRAHFYHVLDGAVGDRMAKLAEAKGFVLLGFYEAGVRNVLNSIRPINTLDDFKGMKIRVIPSSINLDTFRALGANPVPIPYNQLYVALQNKTVDAAEAANSNYEAKKFYEVAPYYALVQWEILVAPMVMSKTVFDGLTPAQQGAVRAAARASVPVERDAYAASDEVAMKALLAAGVKVTKPDRGPWIKAVQPVLDKWSATVGPENLTTIQDTN